MLGDRTSPSVSETVEFPLYLATLSFGSTGWLVNNQFFVGRIVPMVEQWSPKPQVEGSNPSSPDPTFIWWR